MLDGMPQDNSLDILYRMIRETGPAYFIVAGISVDPKTVEQQLGCMTTRDLYRSADVFITHARYGVQKDENENGIDRNNND